MTANTLLLRCSGPMQSWGSRSRFSERDTEREPTKSGVIGLLCAALGRGRDVPLDDLAPLRMGVRVDREGVLRRDYHTALGVRKADPKARPDTLVSNRYYLSDAVFLVGLESGDVEQIRSLQRALERPVWQIFLGRKAFVPSEPVCLPDGVRDGEALEEALRAYPPLCAQVKAHVADTERRLRFVLECRSNDEGETRMDLPVSFVPASRVFATRRVRVEVLDLPREARGEEVEPCT